MYNPRNVRRWEWQDEGSLDKCEVVAASDYDQLVDFYEERKMLHLRFVDAFDQMRARYHAMEDRALAAERMVK